MLLPVSSCFFQLLSSIHCRDTPHLATLPIDEHLGGFQFEAIKNAAAVSICAKVSVWTCVFMFGGRVDTKEENGWAV